jgi:hypothetical protein
MVSTVAAVRIIGCVSRRPFYQTSAALIGFLGCDAGVRRFDLPLLSKLILLLLAAGTAGTAAWWPNSAGFISKH